MRLRMVMPALALVAATATAQEQDTLLEYVIDSCEADITGFCSSVTPGDGRVALCIAAHEDKISDQCTVALYDAASILEQLVGMIAYLGQACSTDIEAHCADTPVGEGRILECLAEQETLSESCSSAVAETVGE